MHFSWINIAFKIKILCLDKISIRKMHKSCSFLHCTDVLNTKYQYQATPLYSHTHLFRSIGVLVSIHSCNCFSQYNSLFNELLTQQFINLSHDQHNNTHTGLSSRHVTITWSFKGTGERTYMARSSAAYTFPWNWPIKQPFCDHTYIISFGSCIAHWDTHKERYFLDTTLVHETKYCNVWRLTRPDHNVWEHMSCCWRRCGPPGYWWSLEERREEKDVWCVCEWGVSHWTFHLLMLSLQSLLNWWETHPERIAHSNSLQCHY